MFKHLGLKSLWIVLALVLVTVPALAQDAPLIGLGSSDSLGSFLVDSEGMTLYIFDRDTLGTSNCYDRCAEAWPPLLVESADDITAAEGIPGEFGTTERTDGTLQVTYNGLPLYYWFRDEAPGDATGHRVGNVWWVMPPATVYAWGNEDLGPFLVGPTGMTLYRFTNDTPGTSNCYDQCATNWPPLTVESADAIVPGVNLLGELGTTERTDGTLQVTYNGWPLYYWKDDAARGDATGENVGEVWFTIPPETVGVSEGGYLTGADGFTLYTFDNDAEGVSNCADECAENWPPLTVAANERVTAGEGVTGELATIERADGRLQVTYNGMPLYYWVEDKAPGDTTGDGVGDVWHLAMP